ncbi:MAG: MOSC N-terminal beta barrel domain-containing protein [Vicinamibacteraceae bacterium]
MTPIAARGDRPVEIGRIEALFRYPVKSMRGERLDAATLGWHGLDGDRRLALRKVADRGAFPWLTAGRLPALLQYGPQRLDAEHADVAPTHVRTPEGHDLPTFGEALAADVGRRHGALVEMMQLKHGIFDDATISVIGAATVEEIGRLAGTAADVRRFRPNVFVRSTRGVPFEEDDWVGGVLTFGDGDEAPAVNVTRRDVRCAMVNIDPDGGPSAPEMLKAVVRANQNNAGVYGTSTRTGRLAVGQPVLLWK